MVDGNLSVIINTTERNTQKHERVVRAIRKVENELDKRLRNQELIGQVIDRKAVDRVRIKARRVTFTWQRGIKIGMFYDCVWLMYKNKFFLHICTHTRMHIHNIDSSEHINYEVYHIHFTFIVVISIQKT